MTRQTKPRSGNNDVQRQIDANLKRAFDTLASEPVPDRFTDLLDKLRKGTAGDAAGDDRDD